MQGGTATKTQLNPTGKLPEGLATKRGPETGELARVRFSNLPLQSNNRPPASNRASFEEEKTNGTDLDSGWRQQTQLSFVSKFGEKSSRLIVEEGDSRGRIWKWEGLQATDRIDERRMLNGLEATNGDWNERGAAVGGSWGKAAYGVVPMEGEVGDMLGAGFGAR
ncbi:unnamed protein product [Linum tenue]|uniref:Uncharacterized protein n=1 Tax=Linum tenue TaxID=586396 RepID=A0AAV0KLK5_9ROSI|nr:unnamed protein product [Linum tenue]